MIRQILLASSLVALMAPVTAFAQVDMGKVTPTIPESQIEAAEFSSPFEYVSAATSIDQFEIEAAALAQERAGSSEVKSFAADMATRHEALMSDIRAAGKADQVDIAKPSVDGEQQGMLGKMEALNGEEFDRAYANTQVYIHQRAIAIHRGYAENQDSLGKFAAAALPSLLTDYTAAITLAETVGVTSAEQQPAEAQ